MLSSKHQGRNCSVGRIPTFAVLLESVILWNLPDDHENPSDWNWCYSQTFCQQLKLLAYCDSVSLMNNNTVALYKDYFSTSSTRVGGGSQLFGGLLFDEAWRRKRGEKGSFRGCDKKACFLKIVPPHISAFHGVTPSLQSSLLLHASDV